MTEIKQNGLVISERDLGENDKILTVLTERYGKLPVIAKGAKSVRNRHMPSTQLFSYASFGLRRKGNFYYIVDSGLIDNYYDIRNDIRKLSLASFICDVVNDVTQEGNCDDEILRLTLNMIYAISKEIKPLELIRAVFEIRLAAELGFSPDIGACHICREKKAEEYYFDIIDGVITCQECKNKVRFQIEESSFTEMGVSKPLCIISGAVAAAITYIVNAKQERVLSFSLDDSQWTSFFDCAEKYLLNHLERGFFSLDFYKSMLI